MSNKEYINDYSNDPDLELLEGLCDEKNCRKYSKRKIILSKDKVTSRELDKLFLSEEE